MITHKLLPAGNANEDVPALIELLHQTGQRLEELTAGEVDTVTNREGRTFLLRHAQDQLRLNEVAKQAAILNSLPAQTALLDSQGAIVSVNESWGKASGTGVLQGPGFEIGRNYPDACEAVRVNDGATGNPVATGIRSVLSGGERAFSIEYSCGSGMEQRWYLVTANPLAQIHSNGAVVMHLEITGQKRAESKIRRLNRVYAVLSGINTLIVRVRDRQELFDEACRIAVEVGEFGIAWIGELDPETLDITPMAWSGIDAKTVANSKRNARSDTPEGLGAASRSIREKKAVFCNDIASAPNVGGSGRKDAIARGFGSLISLPLLVEGVAVGNFSMFAKEANYFDDDELKLLDELAGDVSFALEHIGKEEKITRLSRIQSVMSNINALIVRAKDRQELFDGVCRIAVDQGRFGTAWIGTFDAVALKSTPVAWQGTNAERLGLTRTAGLTDVASGNGVVARAIRAKHAVFENDLAVDPLAKYTRRAEAIRDGLHSLIALPFVVGGSVVGHLSLYAREAGFFDDGEVRLLDELAGDISFALEHFAKEEKIVRLNRIQAVTGGINALIVRARNQQELFDGTCRIAVEEGKFGMAWLGMRDPASLDILPVAWAGMHSDMTTFKASISVDTPRGLGVAGRAYRDARPAVDNDFRQNIAVGAGRRAELVRLGYRSAVGLPISIAGSSVGTLTLYATERDYFSVEELKLLDELTGNISFALENLAKEERIARLSRIQAVMTNVNALIVRADNRQGLFDEACRIAFEHGKFGIAWIGALDQKTLEVTPIAWAGESADALIKIKSSARSDIGAGAGAVGRSIRARHLIFNNDIAAHDFGGPRLKEILRLGYRSHITLPLFEGEIVVGTFTMYAHEVNFFNEDELGLMTELAGHISFALENIAKQEKLEKLSRIRLVSSEINSAIVRVRTQDELLRETCRVAVEHGKFEMVWVGSLDSEKQKIDSVAWEGFSDHAAGAMAWPNVSTPGLALNDAMRTRRLVVRHDLETDQADGILRQEALLKGYRSNVCLPFVLGNEVVAAAIFFAAGRGFFDHDEIVLLDEMASNVSFALEHISRETQLIRLSRIRAVTSEINSLVLRVKDRQELFDNACRIAVDCGNFGLAWIGALDPVSLDVTPVAWEGDGAGVLSSIKASAREDAPAGKGAVGRSIRGRHLIFNNDLATRKFEGARMEEVLKMGFRSSITLPLFEGETVVGTFTMYAKELNFFNAEEVKLLSGLAGDVSFALDHMEKAARADYLVLYDQLTGLPNRRFFSDILGEKLRAVSGEKPSVAVACININRFAMINESFGKEAGDAVLREMAARFTATFARHGTSARLGGDGFAVAISGNWDAVDIARSQAKLYPKLFDAPFIIAGQELRITGTVGLSFSPTDGNEANLLIANAEAALKRAKAGGERSLIYNTKMNSRVGDTLALESKLRMALEREEYVLHYQPKVNLLTGKISGLEALIRWNDPEMGLIPPVKFIPLLEETGMILDVGAWAIRKALEDHHTWQVKGLQPPRIAVNVSAIQLRQDNFVDTVRSATEESKTKPHGLDLEITESLLMQDIEGNIGKLKALRDMSINIAIDDFGTGYSSLGYLARLPVNLLKIDRSFIITMTKNADSMSIVSAIISLAHSLNMKVIAEGVETEEQSRFLKLLKCDEMQGYLFSKPVPAEGIVCLLQANGNPLTSAAEAAQRSYAV